MTGVGARWRVSACGDVGLLVEVAGVLEVLALADAVRGAELVGVLDVVPGARTVLLHTAAGTDLGALRRRVLALPVDPGSDPVSRDPVSGDPMSGDPVSGGTVRIPVVYDGPDLAEVGERTGLGADGVVAAHTGIPWRVAFGGFAPGFAYLAGGDSRLHLPRRSEPRTSVPAGSVGLAGEFSGVYPRPSPGGWQLIGRTDAVLWDESRDPPALLRAGTTVHFVPVPDPPHRDPGHPSPEPDPPPVGRVLEVVATGLSALIEDLGRVGYAVSGVGRSGAADRRALRLANRLVANAEGAAAIEIVFGGLRVRAGRDLPAPLVVALTGAPAPADVDGTPVGPYAPVTLRPGQVLRLGPPPTGLRSYLAVRGGVDVTPVLGSRSSDVLSGIGPAALAPGDVLPIGPEPADLPLVDVAPVAPPPGGPVTLRATLGPHADWTADPGALARTHWTVSDRSDRIGMRLDGEPLRRVDRGELPSEGMVRGAVQVPPGGTPVLFLADHPVTGGYPVVAVVLDADVDRAAQVRPGQQVRFRLVPPPWPDPDPDPS